MFGRFAHWRPRGCGKTVICIRFTNLGKSNKGGVNKEAVYRCEKCMRKYSKKQILELEGKTKWQGGTAK